ncbi:MAG: MBL fold metallo-hydrolase [Christensenellales bacterium]|jgi:L-ascorbate metabolism protein UlaG (beta-lactamase superfamily)
MKLTYLYNSGFMVETEECLLIFDYIKNSEGQQLLGGCETTGDILRDNVYVFVSHAHADHYTPHIFQWTRQNPGIKYILCRDLKGVRPKSSTVKFMDEGRTFSDNHLSVRALGSTDEGISFLTHTDNHHIFHAGDLNLWHWKDEVSAAESAQYERAFQNEMRKIKEHISSPLDLAFFPVDPRLQTDYYAGALAFAESFRPCYFVPMHFGGDFTAANAPQKEIEALGVQFVPLHQYGQTVLLSG